MPKIDIRYESTSNQKPIPIRFSMHQAGDVDKPNHAVTPPFPECFQIRNKQHQNKTKELYENTYC
jgi:hypothetical protein